MVAEGVCYVFVDYVGMDSVTKVDDVGLSERDMTLTVSAVEPAAGKTALHPLYLYCIDQCYITVYYITFNNE